MKAPVVTLEYQPHPALIPFHARSKSFAVVVAHRRFGKTYGICQDIVGKALKFAKIDSRTGQVYARPQFAYVCPQKNQAKKVAWGYLKDFTAKIPGVKVNESSLTIEFTNAKGVKATIFVLGADDPDSFRGMYLDGVVLDEFADMKTGTDTAILPCLSDRGGWVVYMGTPKGKNEFYDLVLKAQANPKDYFYLCIKASENKFMTKVQEQGIALHKRVLTAEGIEQEYECSFETSLKGSYYADFLRECQDRYCFRRVKYDHTQPVSCAMDIGRIDATAIWFWQLIDGEVRFIDYWEKSGFYADLVCQALLDKPYEYEAVWLPHDAAKQEFSSERNVIDTFLRHGLPAKKVPKPDGGNRIIHGVSAVREFMRFENFVMDTERCARGIDALKNYSRKYSNASKCYVDEPEHDEWSHGADAFRYAVQSIKPSAVQRSKEQAIARGRPSQVVNKQITIAELFAAHEREMKARQRAGRRV